MRVTFPVDSVDSTIKKSLFDSINNNIKELLGIKDIPTFYEGGLANYFQPGSTIGEKEKVTIGSQRRMVVMVDEVPNEHSVTARHTSGLIEGNIFEDPRYNIFGMPIPHNYDVTFTVNVRSPSRNEINQLIQGIRFRQNQGRLNFMTGGEFHYYIPLEAIQLLVDLHTTASQLDTTLPSVDKYIMGGMTSPVTVMTDQKGGQTQLAARHEVAGIELTYDTIGLKTDKTESYYYTEITFSFSYDSPQDFQVIYPLFLAGNSLNVEWWPHEFSPFIVDYDRAYRNPLIKAGEDMNAFEWMQIPWHYTGEHIGSLPEGNLPLITFDINPHEVEPDADGWILIFNFSELPIGFTDNTYTYFKDVAINDSTFARSIITVTFYAGTFSIARENIRVDSDLNVWVKVEREIHVRYSVSIDIQINLHTNNKETLDTMRDHPDVFVGYIKTIYPKLPDNDKWLWDKPAVNGRPPKDWLTEEGLEELLEKDYVPTEALDQLGDLSDRSKLPHKGMKTQHISTVLVKRKEV